MVGGAVVDVVWLICLSGSTGVYEIVPGFICGFLCCVVVSLLDKKPSDEVLAIYETATAKGFDEEN